METSGSISIDDPIANLKVQKIRELASRVPTGSVEFGGSWEGASRDMFADIAENTVSLQITLVNMINHAADLVEGGIQSFNAADGENAMNIGQL